jgi:DNA-binding response OmpR family regulator
MHAHQILFVEDDPIIGIASCDFMRDRGMSVLDADCATGAAAIIQRRCYLSSLVTDVDLGPGEDGYAVARRARAAYPGLPVVFISGCAGKRHATEGVEGSIFIDKPYHPRQIVDALAAIWARAPTGAMG